MLDEYIPLHLTFVMKKKCKGFFFSVLGQEVCQWEGSLVINKPVWYAEVFFCGPLFSENNLSNFILHARISHLLFPLTVQSVSVIGITDCFE